MRPNAVRQASTIALTDALFGHVAFMGADRAAELGDARDRLLHRLAVLVGGEDLGAFRANSTAVARPLPQPGPTHPAPVTSATLSCRRPAMPFCAQIYCVPFSPIFSTSAPHFTRSDLM